MVAPEGFYSLWITPANGGRPRKINDRLKVQAGKLVATGFDMRGRHHILCFGASCHRAAVHFRSG